MIEQLEEFKLRKAAMKSAARPSITEIEPPTSDAAAPSHVAEERQPPVEPSSGLDQVDDASLPPPPTGIPAVAVVSLDPVPGSNPAAEAPLDAPAVASRAPDRPPADDAVATYGDVPAPTPSMSPMTSPRTSRGPRGHRGSADAVDAMQRSSSGELWTQNAALKENLERERAEHATTERSLRAATDVAERARDAMEAELTELRRSADEAAAEAESRRTRREAEVAAERKEAAAAMEATEEKLAAALAERDAATSATSAASATEEKLAAALA